jgi:hypothetical protein
MSGRRVRLPVIAEAAEDDPLQLLRGGRFARWFAGGLAVFGLAWIVAARVEARDTADTVVLAHSSLRASAVLLAAPPKPPVEDLPPQGTPPMPAIEDITPPRADDLPRRCRPSNSSRATTSPSPRTASAASAPAPARSCSPRTAAATTSPA